MPKLLIPIIVSIIILGTMGLSFDVFADQAIVQSWVANDPDDGDTIYSAGDTLTITFSVDTNATTSVTVPDAQIKANFTFGTPNIATGATFSGIWTDLKTFVITVVTAGTSPTINTSTVSASGSNNIGTAVDGQNNGLGSAHAATGTSSALTGDFGLFVAATTKKSGGDGCLGDCQEPTLGVLDNGKRIVSNGFTYNGKSIDVERFFTPYPLVTVQTGKQNIAEFKIYENEGPDNISHFELAFGLANGESIGMSKAVINWDKSWDGIETVTLVDPDNVLENILVTTSEEFCLEESQQKCLIVKIIHTFRAPLDFNILGTNVWDTNRNTWQNYYNHGIEVIGASLNPPKEYLGINKGHIYHLTETSKTNAVDEFGYTWTLQHNVWEKDYVSQVKTDREFGFDRNHSKFLAYKHNLARSAENTLNEICSKCADNPYAEINNVKLSDFTERVDKKSDPQIKAILDSEALKAEQSVKKIFKTYYPGKVFD